jgi:DNA polymerase III delta prime subunit
MQENKFIRFCPNCHTERPLAEMFCEGTVGSARCNWNLMMDPVRPVGWQPTSVVPIEPSTPTASLICTNGHPLENGDLMCSMCGADAASATPASEPNKPTVIAGWRVLREISRAEGLRDRFLVEEENSDRRGVLTLYHHGAEPDSATYDALQRISSKYVAEIYVTGRWNERAFEVAEELTGGSLEDLGIVAHDSAAIRRIVHELGRALDSLADVGLRHRDIRPGTLLVRNRDPLDLVVGSFGSARLSVSDLDIVAPLEITRYTAPEAVAGGVAAASDWWSLGIVLLEQITGGACFEGVSQQAFLIHVLASSVPLPDDLPPDLCILFRGLLARDRVQRWKWPEVQAWLEGRSPEAPAWPNEYTNNDQGPSVTLGGKNFYTPQIYALAAAEAGHWNEARDQLVRGVLTTWAQDANLAPKLIAGLRRIARQDALNEDFRLLVALKILNPEMPPIFRGNIVTPQWLLMEPLDGYELITGPVPEMLEQLGTENWLLRLKERGEVIRNRAHNLAIDLDEDTLRINLLSTSRARLTVEWDERRKLLPDTEHHGLLSLLERRTVSEEDLIVLLSAAISQFRSCNEIVEEARNLARTHGIHQFDEVAVREMARLPRIEILQAVAERIEGFARCSNTELNEWADEFRLEKRMQLAKALALLSVPGEQWQEPQKQQYVAQILEFFEKKIVSSVMRGPLVRMTIGKNTPRVDLAELGTPRMKSGSILDHLLQRNSQAVALDFTALCNPESTTGSRLQSLERHTQLYKRDTGIDGLYLGFPILLAKDTKSNSSTRIAPLLLWPVRVHHEVGTRGQVTVAFDSEREEVRLNPALDAILGPERTKTWCKAADEMLGRSSLNTADVIDAFGTFATPRSRNLVSLPGPKTTIPANTLELECSAVLFHMTFIGQAIGEDIRLLKSLPPTGTGLETALRLTNNMGALKETEAKPREIDRYFTVHSDPSQEEAVLRARSGPGLLVEGPPGTGKSQTIVNMVGDAIGQKRNLLIVCQKHAALEVVHKRLVAEGLGNRIVMVNDVNRDRQPIIRAVREQLEELFRRSGDPASQIRRNREVTAARVESLEGTFDKHHEALHQVDDRIGLSFRVLLGDLIKLESPSAPINVPALRPILAKLNVGEMASLEEELAPLAGYWLPARYESSALSNLASFAPDQAIVGEFLKSFQDFAKAESLRVIVITTRQASFEVDDPAPHRTWLNAHGNEILELPERHRALLARWLPLFRATDGSDYLGNKVIEDLKRVRDALAACRDTDHDAQISPHLVRVPTKKLEKISKLAKEALVPVSFFGRLNPFRRMRLHRVHQFLVSLNDTGDTERIVALVAAASLELRWRHLRGALSEAHSILHLPDLEPDAGPTLLNTTTITLGLAQQVATYAAYLAKAPWQDRLDTVVLAGTKDAILTLYAEFDAAFARCEAKLDSLRALKYLENWMAPDWFTACNEAIAKNQVNSTRIQPIESALPSLAAYQYFRGRVQHLSKLAVVVFGTLRGKEADLNTVATSELDCEVRRILNREARLGWMHSMQQTVPELTLERSELESKVVALEKLDDEMRRLNRELLKEDYDLQAIRPLREWDDITRLTGQRARRLREFIEIGTNLGLMKLRPVWLMNPDVASRVLPLKSALFDTVIYDEASQMLVEFALPSLFRAKVTVVSGDEKQMPPTAFFTSKLESDEAQDFDGEMPDEDATDEELESFEEIWNRREIKDCPDLLQLARTSMPNTRLKIHYRSDFRELIGYSNAAFYGNDLSVPIRHPDSVVLSSKPIEMVRVNGVYHEQTNPLEAEKVVDILSELWQLDYALRPSVGVVTFNRKQADLIEEVLELRAQKDHVFREAYRLERERNEDGEDMGVFVKNVENVQGDERDIIIFSSTFGRNKQGTFLRKFGVLGQKGGERRLNVAVTRSRKKVIMVTSMPIAEISDFLTTRHPPSTPRDFLQGYMEYARAISSGELSFARTLLSRMTGLRETSTSTLVKRADDGFYHAVGELLRSTGHAIKVIEEVDAFALDYAIEHPESGLFVLGIECDAPRHPLLGNARAREVWRRKVLYRSIPVIHRVSSYGWYQDAEQEHRRLLDAVSKAINMETVV